MKNLIQKSIIKLSICLVLGSSIYPIANSSGLANTTAPNSPENSYSGQKKRSMQLQNTYIGFQSPTGIIKDKEGNLYVANWSGGIVSRVSLDGTQSTFASGMGSPAGLAFDQDENLYIADYSRNVIYKVAADGESVVFATGLRTPTGIYYSQSGDLLVTNRASNEVVKISPNGDIRIFARGLKTPVGVVEDEQGNLYITNYGGGIYKVTPDGQASIFTEEFSRPGVGIARNSQGELFAIDNGAGSLRQIHPNGTTTTVINSINGAVALYIQGDRYFVGAWDQGVIYEYTFE